MITVRDHWHFFSYFSFRPGKRRGAAAMVALPMLLSSLPPGAAYAVFIDARSLKAGEFFANDLLQRDRDWYWDGTLDTFNRPWEDTHTFSAIALPDQFRDVTGERIASHTNTSFNLQFRGEFTDVASLLGYGASWSDNLITHNAHRDNGELIPGAWRSGDGYGTPAGVNASFKRDYSVKKQKFSVGEFGCPATVPKTGQKTRHCIFQEAWFAGLLDIEAHLQAVGDISNVIIGTQSVSGEAKADRKTKFRVNGNTLVDLADITTSSTSFDIIEGDELAPVNLVFEGTFGEDEKKVTVNGDTVWEGGDVNHAEVSGGYSETASTNKYFTADGGMKFIIEILDDPFLVAGLNGNSFNSGLIFARIGAANVEEAHKAVALAIPVAEPATFWLFAAGMLGLAARLRRRH